MNPFCVRDNPSMAFVAYVTDPDLHDGRVLGMDRGRDTVSVVVETYSGDQHVIVFSGVEDVEESDPDGMLLYALAEVEAPSSLRRFVFVNSDEESDHRRLEVLARTFEFDPASLADTDPAILSLGAVVGGVLPNPRKWGDAVSELTRHVVDVRGDEESPLRLNVVYYISGEVLTIDWEGVRTGRFDRNTKHLMVQVTLPAMPPEDPRGVVLERLRAAVDEAETWARKKGIAEELPAIKALVRRL